MSENEYLKLLGNKIFWSAMIMVGGGLLTASGLFYGLRGEIRMNRQIEVSEHKDIRNQMTVDSLNLVNYKNNQSTVDQIQNDDIRRVTVR